MTDLLITRRAVVAGLPYRGYWEDLRRDFFRTCAYCTISEFEAQAIGFEIDHFEPRSAKPELVNIYSNLMYSCCPCNRIKSGECTSEELRAAGYGFIKVDQHEYGEHFRVDGRRLVATTKVGEYSIEFLELNRSSLLTLREARQIFYRNEDFTKAGVVSLRNYRIDRLPERIRLRVNELKKLAEDAQSRLYDELDELLSAFAGSDIAVSEEDREAYAQEATQRRRAKAEFRAMNPRDDGAPRS